jgi:hypothetical protein
MQRGASLAATEQSYTPRTVNIVTTSPNRNLNGHLAVTFQKLRNDSFVYHSVAHTHFDFFNHYIGH